MTPQQIKRFTLPAILIGGLGAFFASGAADFLTWQALGQHYGLIKTFTDSRLVHAYGLFFLVYLLAVAFSLPVASLLTLGGGAVFGWPAAVLVVAGATGGAALVFSAARGVFADLLRARAGPFLARLETGFSKNDFAYLLVLRLVPAAPFWAVNIIPAFTRMRLASFVGATALGIIPGTLVFVGIGRGFDHILAAGQTPDLGVLTTPQVLLPLTGLGVLALLPIVFKSVTARIKDRSHDRDQS